MFLTLFQNFDEIYWHHTEKNPKTQEFSNVYVQAYKAVLKNNWILNLKKNKDTNLHLHWI